jgi:cytoskeletal protein CcmA (bactofilin family)
MRFPGISLRRTAGFTVIDSRLTIRGDVDTEDSIRIDGRVEGLNHRAGAIVVSTTGRVTGDIEAREVVVAGHVSGSIHALGRLQVEATGVVEGDIRATAMLLHEGGTIHGNVIAGAGAAGAGGGAPAAGTGARRLGITGSGTGPVVVAR